MRCRLYDAIIGEVSIIRILGDEVGMNLMTRMVVDGNNVNKFMDF